MAQKYVGTHKGYKDLPSDVPDEITAVLYYPDGNYVEDLTDLTPEEIEAVQEVRTPLTSFKVITYFKVRDENKDVVTEFYPSLELHLNYTHEAWFASSNEDFWKEKGRPRVYYLEKSKKGWVGDWEEFPDLTIYASPPKDSNSSGSLIISVAYMPDPRIGGC